MKRSSFRPRTPIRPAARSPSGPTIRGYTPPAEPVLVTTAPRSQGDAIEKPLRLRSRAYLDSVKRDPCAIGLEMAAFALACDCAGTVDAHHVLVRGRRDDTFDLTAIPLCRRHHDAAHRGLIRAPDLHRMLGAYLVRKLPRLTQSEARAVLGQMLTGLE